jgi:hypothetical protein
MGEANTLMRVVIALGIIFLLAGLLYPGSQSGWNNFSSSVRAFPSFNNPFTQNAISTKFVPDARDLYESTDYEDAVGCSDAEYWRCVNTNDGDSSYIKLGPDGIVLKVNMTDPFYDGIIQRMTLEIICRSVGAAPPIRAFQFGGDVELLNSPTCPVSSAYSSLKFDINFPWTISNPQLGPGAVILDEDLVVPGQSIRITYIEVVIYTVRDPSCSGFDCVNRFFESIMKGVIFFINALVFVGQVLAYLGGLVAGFFGIVGFLFAIPDAPEIVQSIITIAVVGMILWIIFVFIRTIRGSSSGG